MDDVISATGMSASADASGSAGLPRLTGVIVGPLGGLAIFASNDGKPHTVAEGDKIGNFTVRTIGSAASSSMTHGRSLSFPKPIMPRQTLETRSPDVPRFV